MDNSSADFSGIFLLEAVASPSAEWRSSRVEGVAYQSYALYGGKKHAIIVFVEALDLLPKDTLIWAYAAHLLDNADPIMLTVGVAGFGVLGSVSRADDAVIKVDSMHLGEISCVADVTVDLKDLRQDTSPGVTQASWTTYTGLARCIR